jgi:KDO2-lipid IV(A) lauroyltransferase
LKRDNRSFGTKAAEYAIAKTILAVLASLRLVPYKQRVALGGAFFQYVVSRVSKNKERILENIDHVVPELDSVARARLLAGAPNNMGRTLTELFFPDEFLKVIDNCPITGDGYQAFKIARAHRHPVILVAGHIGNYDAIRGKLVREGHPIGSLYKPMKNPYFDREYVKTISRIGFPLFPNDVNGMGQMIKALRRGETIALMMDQAMNTGEKIPFMGRICNTPVSAAKMALKHNAMLIPCFAHRNEDGITHTGMMEAPIEHTDPITMTRQLNDLLEKHVRAHMEQWLWTHRRWKGYYGRDE